ncbi:MAG: tetratricopeptide repeat protein [Deltaproteobacteria bacterium]|nr:tetratricopeptide repeat protein [Deltaproteobacteria bacterium]
MNYYEILQVDTKASTDVIKSAYRVLLKTAGHHPDLGGDAAVATQINLAYEVLSDAAKRREYDHQIIRQGGARIKIQTIQETLFIVFCPHCGKKNRLRDEPSLPNAKCGGCHSRLIPRKNHPFAGEEESSFRLGMYLFEKGLMERAVKEFQSAVRIKADNPNYRYWLSRTHYERKSYDKAFSEIKVAVNLKPSSFQFQFWMGQILYSKKDYHHAAMELKKAVALRPDHVSSWRRLGNCFYHTREFNEAAAAFEKAVELDPRDSQNHRWLGIARLSAHQPAQALEAFRDAETLEPDDPLIKRYIQICENPQ